MNWSALIGGNFFVKNIFTIFVLHYECCNFNQWEGLNFNRSQIFLSKYCTIKITNPSGFLFLLFSFLNISVFSFRYAAKISLCSAFFCWSSALFCCMTYGKKVKGFSSKLLGVNTFFKTTHEISNYDYVYDNKTYPDY